MMLVERMNDVSGVGGVSEVDDVSGALRRVWGQARRIGAWVQTPRIRLGE
jgi:hypothetical protein